MASRSRKSEPVDPRGPRRLVYLLKCNECESPFRATRADAVLCSSTCRQRRYYWNLRRVSGKKRS
jgi:hypothetical protein